MKNFQANLTNDKSERYRNIKLCNFVEKNHNNDNNNMVKATL